MSVKSAMRVFEIMDCLTEVDEGLTVKEISNKLNYPQSSTFNLVQTMYESGYLIQTASKRYKLGPKFIYIGSRALKAFDLPSEARPYLEKLMHEVEETVFMAVLSGDELVYIAKVDSNRSIKTSAEIGSSRPLYCTGLGKAFLSFLPLSKREEFLDRIELKPITPKTVTDRLKLTKQLDTFKENGYAIDDEENEEGLYCFSAPIFNTDGEVVAAISIAGPKNRITRDELTTVKDLLETSRVISKSLGFFS
jgi:DNA-binding IclR family transcriptional regulator